jgi:hypothetical protein
VISFGVNKEVNILRSMPEYKDIQVDRLKNVFLKSCSGEKQATAGHAFLNLTFESANGEKASYLHDFVIRSFSGKSRFVEEVFLLLQDEHIIVLCFYFSC